MERPLPLGSCSGHRGGRGELTIRVASGDAAPWTGLDRVLVMAASGASHETYEIETARSYRDRLVLKLRGVDDAGAAAEFRGRVFGAPPGQIPDLPDGRYYLDRLIGLQVEETDGSVVGRIVDVLQTAATEVVVVHGLENEGDEAVDEVLIPLVRDMVLEVDVDGGRMVVRLPEGLRDINRAGRGSV